MALLKPFIGCAPHTCTSKITKGTDKEVYLRGQTSWFREKQALLGKQGAFLGKVSINKICDIL